MDHEFLPFLFLKLVYILDSFLLTHCRIPRQALGKQGSVDAETKQLTYITSNPERKTGELRPLRSNLCLRESEETGISGEKGHDAILPLEKNK